MRARSGGFSLIELMVAMAIAAILGTAMAALFARTVETRKQIEADGSRIETGRYAVDAISDDVRLAGFYGDFQPRSGDGPWPAVSAADNTWTTPAACDTAFATHWANASAVSASVPVAIQGFEAHGTSGLVPPSCLTNYLAGTDILVVRRLSSVAHVAGSGTVTNGDVYVQASNCNNTSTDGGLKFKVSASQGDFTLHELNCTSVAKVRKYVIHVYFIADCNVCTPTKDGIPTLSVAEYIENASPKMQVRQVAAGIEDMHVEYGVDTTVDGAPDSYQVSTASGTPAFAWQNVTAAKVYLLARDMKTTDGYTNSKQYVLGQKTVAAKNDAYKRGVFSTTVRLVNPAGAREP